MATKAPQRAKKRKKNRKHGRNKTFCLYYRNTNRREHNKLRRLAKHLTRFPADACAHRAVEVAKAAIRGY